MKKLSFLVIIIAIAFAGCKTIKPADFQPDYQNANLLPRMDIWFDVPSFENAYGANSYSADGSTSPESPYGKGVFMVNSKTKIYTAEKRIQDGCNLWVNDVQNNIMDPTGKRTGNIVLRIGNAYNKNNYKWSWLSAFTLGVFNAMGMPMASNKTEIEVIVEIYDLRNNLVAKFSERGTAKTYMAAYHGYYEFQRKCASEALEDGLVKVKELIQKDYQAINAKLR
ncbi:MAG: hypothetical protein ACK5M0_03380 [Bacteroidales bacterium]|jgi:hypothetical protein